jgi:hypothetical protein
MGQRHRQARKEGENQKMKVQQGVREVYERGNSGVLGERECKRKQNDGEIHVGTRRERTGTGWKERKGGEGCAMRRERDNRAHVEWM